MILRDDTISAFGIGKRLQRLRLRLSLCHLTGIKGVSLANVRGQLCTAQFIPEDFPPTSFSLSSGKNFHVQKPDSIRLLSCDGGGTHRWVLCSPAGAPLSLLISAPYLSACPQDLPPSPPSSPPASVGDHRLSTPPAAMWGPPLSLQASRWRFSSSWLSGRRGRGKEEG